MLKQFELTQIGSVAPEYKEELFELSKESQSLVERIKGRMNIFRITSVDVPIPDKLNNPPNALINGVTKLF